VCISFYREPRTSLAPCCVPAPSKLDTLVVEQIDQVSPLMHENFCGRVRDTLERLTAR
jgi:hypothetical protein